MRLSDKDSAVGTMCDNHHGAVLIARPFIFLLKHHWKLQREIGIVVEILIKRRTIVLQTLDEIGSNIIPQFSIFWETVILILIEPAAETSVKLLCAAGRTIAVEGSEELALILA